MDLLIQGLLRPEAYDHPVAGFQVLETHISWVILTGESAYKLKKPVNLGFVDFTTLARRHHFCEEEVRLNRRLAPELYLGVLPLFGPREHATSCGTGEPIEYAVRMRQFDQRDLLPAVLERGEVRSEQLDQLAETIAAFHRQAATASSRDQYGTPKVIRAAVFGNLDVLDKLPDERDAVAALREWGEREFARRHDWFAQRRATGRVRECHGDMHLGNMFRLNDVIRIFDCLEFNPQLRWTDVIAEIAFLVMDLQERGRPDSAARVLNRWLEQSGDYSGLIGWRWYFVYRALVRAKVAALRLRQNDLEPAERTAKQSELRTYLALAQSWTGPRPAAIVLMHGFSGSGKSFVSERICEQFAAIRLRSDIERKRLFGQWGDPGPRQLTGNLYTNEVTETVYRDILAEDVPHILNAGFSAVIDATCLHRWQRDIFREAAARLGVRYVIVDVQADPAILRQRLRERQIAANHDPSDADLAVLEMQFAAHEPLSAEERLTTLVVDTGSTNWWPQLASELHQIGEIVPTK